MATGDIPMMTAGGYASSSYFGNDFISPMQANLMEQRKFQAAPTNQILSTPKPNPVLGAFMTERRVVQVFIADPNENIPLDDCLLYKGEEKLTDATDQELFFELDIKNLLEKHNLTRTKVVDKKVKDRTEYLEPAKVRDLKMVVVTVAKL
jgi:hypothetical protein